MRDLAGDPGVFIRSMATRGSLGGLASSTAGVVQALDAAGFELILIETVGAGQAEVDIARLAHTTVVIEAPGLGDDIQAIKAGILEIADVLVINKSDRPGVEITERALKSMLQLAHPAPRIFQHHGHHLEPEQQDFQPASGWFPEIIKTVAMDGTGIADLAGAIDRHTSHLRESGDWQRRDNARLEAELDLLLRETLFARWRQAVPPDQFLAVRTAMLQREISPWQAVQRLTQAQTGA
jgi:LAO/AO transport system kinase